MVNKVEATNTELVYTNIKYPVLIIHHIKHQSSCHHHPPPSPPPPHNNNQLMYAHLHPNLVVSPSKAHRLLFTKLRDRTTSSADFVRYSQRAMRLVAEDALAEFPTETVDIATACAPSFRGTQTTARQICAVSILRSGHALLEAVRAVEPTVSVGQLLVQRDETLADKPARLYYQKLPPTLGNGDHGQHVLLCDPMLATGGSAVVALEALVKVGVDPAKIVFATMICCPEGLRTLQQKFPAVKIVTACVDECLNEEKYIVPGLGDYGDRYYNT